MRISHKYKFIFFSNPKSGSESLREILNPFSDIKDCLYKEKTDENPFYSHITPKEVLEIFEQKGWDYESYYKFICVRNPYSKLVSLYEMIYRRWPIKPPFSFWLKSIKTDGTGGGGKKHERWRKYGAYALENIIFDNKSNMLVDEVLKLENLSKDLPVVLNKIGIENPHKIEIIKKNTKKKKKKIFEYYNDDLIELVKNKYAWEIDEFNYEFPD